MFASDSVQVQYEQLHGEGRAGRGKYDGDIRCLRNCLQEMHNKKIFGLENEGQDHGIQQSQ